MTTPTGGFVPPTYPYDRLDGFRDAADRFEGGAILYGGWCLNEAVGQQPSRRPLGPAEIVAVHDLGTMGYLVALATADGRLRYRGWQIEQVVAPTMPTRRSTFMA